MPRKTRAEITAVLHKWNLIRFFVMVGEGPP
jgi:hypothetical protein